MNCHEGDDLPIKSTFKLICTQILFFFCRHDLEISIEDMKAIFDPVVNKIIDLIREQLKAAPQCNFVFLVGGFAQSPYLNERVKAAFPEWSNKILSPPEPGECELLQNSGTICDSSICVVKHFLIVVSRDAALSLNASWRTSNTSNAVLIREHLSMPTPSELYGDLEQ